MSIYDDIRAITDRMASDPDRCEDDLIQELEALADRGREHVAVGFFRPLHCECGATSTAARVNCPHVRLNWRASRIRLS